MTVRDRIEAKINAAFQPVSLHIHDDSASHAGHVGARPEGETHFTVEVVAEAFAGKSRIDRQRLVHQTLAEELAGPVHALSIKAHAPGEPGAS